MAQARGGLETQEPFHDLVERYHRHHSVIGLVFMRRTRICGGYFRIVVKAFAGVMVTFRSTVSTLRRLSQVAKRTVPEDGLSLRDFVNPKFVGVRVGGKNVPIEEYSELQDVAKGASYNLQTFGCQMNVSDSELVRGILNQRGFLETDSPEDAEIMLFNTCSIREKAEERVLQRLSVIRKANLRQKREKRTTVCVLGCMAERLKTKLLDELRLADIVVGPDSYRDLPRLLSIVKGNERGTKAYNVQLSVEETYADLRPVRTSGNGVSAFVSIMRGCANMCSYCIVPFTRGRERSRPMESILDEVHELAKQGYKEVVLLGQNVNSYNDVSNGSSDVNVTYAPGFKTIYRPPKAGRTFAALVDAVCGVSDEMRVRYTSPHPKDFPDELIELHASRRNLSPHIHLPLQSGSDTVLERMKRGYTREVFLGLVKRLREARPDLALSTDIITGFCGEMEDDHTETLHVVKEAKFENAFVFAYSKREKTHASRHLDDDVEHAVKIRRLQEINELWRSTALLQNQSKVGTMQTVLVEGPSNNSDALTGRTPHNTRAVVPNLFIKPGSYVDLPVRAATHTVLYF